MISCSNSFIGGLSQTADAACIQRKSGLTWRRFLQIDALISPEYLALNEQLHADREDYGARGHTWAHNIERMASDRNCASILDYGCGKGFLAGSLRFSSVFPCDVREYDPAIPGKDAEPKPADLVACFDVLEHVEPDKIDAVLDHLRRLSQKVCVFSICTVPASKTLADGRNAHVLLRPADWWAERLERYFDLDIFEVTATHVRGVGKPKLYEPNIVTLSALDGEQRLAHARENMKRVKARLSEHEPHDGKAIIICYGPSLSYTWTQINRSSLVISVSGAHKFLIDRDIVPFAHIDCDPREHKARQFGAPSPDVFYWLASCVHPAFIDRLKGHSIALWHLWNGDESKELLDAIEPGEWLVQGGGSVGLRALMLLYCMGYRDFEIHGMDCSYADGQKYAGPHLGKPHHDLRIKCGDRWFDTGASMVAYAQQFFITRAVMHDATIRLHGDGLLQHMVRTQQVSIHAPA